MLECPVRRIFGSAVQQQMQLLRDPTLVKDLNQVISPERSNRQRDLGARTRHWYTEDRLLAEWLILARHIVIRAPELRPLEYHETSHRHGQHKPAVPANRVSSIRSWVFADSARRTIDHKCGMAVWV